LEAEGVASENLATWRAAS